MPDSKKSTSSLLIPSFCNVHLWSAAKGKTLKRCHTVLERQSNSAPEESHWHIMLPAVVQAHLVWSLQLCNYFSNGTENVMNMSRSQGSLRICTTTFYSAFNQTELRVRWSCIKSLAPHPQNHFVSNHDPFVQAPPDCLCSAPVPALCPFSD